MTMLVLNLLLGLMAVVYAIASIISDTEPISLAFVIAGLGVAVFNMAWIHRYWRRP